MYVRISAREYLWPGRRKYTRSLMHLLAPKDDSRYIGHSWPLVERKEYLPPSGQASVETVVAHECIHPSIHPNGTRWPPRKGSSVSRTCRVRVGKSNVDDPRRLPFLSFWLLSHFLSFPSSPVSSCSKSTATLLLPTPIHPTDRIRPHSNTLRARADVPDEEAVACTPLARIYSRRSFILILIANSRSRPRLSLIPSLPQLACPLHRKRRRPSHLLGYFLFRYPDDVYTHPLPTNCSPRIHQNTVPLIRTLRTNHATTNDGPPAAADEQSPYTSPRRLPHGR